MLNAFFLKYRFALKWIGIAFLIKGALFLLFAVLFYQNWSKSLITHFIFIASNDTHGYYQPVEFFVNSGTYNSYCRMPGLLPIYAPLYYLFSEGTAKVLVILLQFIVSTVSVYLLAQTSVYVFKDRRSFYFTFFIYAFSSFVSNWDHYGLSDSFGTSFLVCSVYFCMKFRQSFLYMDLFLSGLFITWSVFFRPVHGIVIPLLVLLYFVDLRHLKQSVINCMVFCAPLAAMLSIWTISTYKKYNKVILLQGPLSECFGSVSPELLSARELIIGWGGDYQPWSKGSEAEWFFNEKIRNPSREVIKESYLTSHYNYDSLLILRKAYQQFSADTLPAGEKKIKSELIIEKSSRYLAYYKKEHGLAYYFTNRLKVLKQLLIPNRLDDFPTPKFSDMSIFQKALKAFYFLFFLGVSVLGTLTCLYLLYKKNLFVLIPLVMILLIGVVLGYVEQRYLVPAFPYLTVTAAFSLQKSWERVRKKDQISK